MTGNNEKQIDIASNLSTTISCLFRAHDMYRGESNKARMRRLYEFCMKDIANNPALEEALATKKGMDFFVVQSMMYLIPMESTKK